MKLTSVLGGVFVLLASVGLSGTASAQNLIQNGSFDEGADGWSVPGWWAGGAGETTVEDGRLCVRVDTLDEHSWGAQLRQAGLRFEAGQPYTLSFKAWASTPLELPIEVHDDLNEYWFMYTTNQYIDAPLDGEPNLLSYTATVAEDTDTAWITFVLGAGIIPVGETLCIDDVVFTGPEAEEESASFLSFEDDSRLWTGSPAQPVVSRVAGGTDGDFALSVKGRGYVEVSSPVFETVELESLGDKLAVDVLLSQAQSNPWWLGDIQLLVSVPSAGIHHQWVGWTSFAGVTLGSWSTLEFALPPGVVAALAGNYADAQFHLAVNTDNGAGSTLLDNVRLAD